MTYFAVRMSSQPPDSKHPYGHGKVENLSALGETLLLFVTCVWIVHEAVARLMNPVAVEVTVWSFGVMALSVVVDWSRSRMLLRVARAHNSQALEADALHFSTDIWSSLVVIAGLGAVWAADSLAPESALRPLLAKADPVAALMVSAIVMLVSYRLGRRAVDALLDGGCQETAALLRDRAAGVPGVRAVRRVRARQSGPHWFVDMELSIRHDLSFHEAHAIVDETERIVREALPGADVMVHFEPEDKEAASLIERVKGVAAARGLGVHNVRVVTRKGRAHLELHVEVPGDATLSEAHARADALEAALLDALPVDAVISHIEPALDSGIHSSDEAAEDFETVRRTVFALAESFPGIGGVHDLEVLRDADGLSVVFHCHLAPPDMPIAQAHDLVEQLETELRKRLPHLGRVLIHMEPLDSHPGPEV